MCLLVAVLCGAGTMQAQESGDGTIYSRFGIGELQSFSSSRISAMGGGGVAMHSPNYLNLSNPASLGHQLLTRIAIGGEYRALEATNAAGEESMLQGGGLTAVQFGLPLLANKLGLGFAFRPYSLVNYRVLQQEGILVDPTTEDSSLYRVSFGGSGGLQQIQAAGGYRLSENFSVGASADLVFGLFEDARETVFPSGGFDDTNLQRATRLFGITGTAGALYEASGLLGDEDFFNAGLSFTLPTNLSGRQVLTLGEGLDPDTLQLQGEDFLEGSITVPWQLRLGAAYQPDNRWAFVVDGEYQPWSNFESDFASRRFSTPGGTSYSDRMRMSGGLEFLPAGEDRLAPFYARTIYRLGAYFEHSYTSPIEDVNLQSMAVTAGLSLPTLISGTRIDLLMEAGLRGTTEHALVQDRYLKVSAHVNIGERWFLERRVR